MLMLKLGAHIHVGIFFLPSNVMERYFVQSLLHKPKWIDFSNEKYQFRLFQFSSIQTITHLIHLWCVLFARMSNIWATKWWNIS
jgi:hypothetical protein